MNQLIETGMLTEIPCGTNFTYVLKDPGSLLSVEYKVLQSQTNSVFIPCMKMLHNGNAALYYLVPDNCKPLSTMIPTLNTDRFIHIVGNLLSSIIDVKNNGFLFCVNIDSSFEHIYVDQNTYKVSLVYLPLGIHEYEDDASFENALRLHLIRTISENANLTNTRTAQLTADLQNGTLSMEALHTKLGGLSRMDDQKSGVASSGGQGSGGSGRLIRPGTGPLNGPGSGRLSSMRLISMENGMELTINKPEFTIGKKESNDGVLDFNKMISRFHCKIVCSGQKYSVVDLNSANGTYVNGARLASGQTMPLKNGDELRLANSNFQVVIR